MTMALALSVLMIAASPAAPSVEQLEDEPSNHATRLS